MLQAAGKGLVGRLFTKRGKDVTCAKVDHLSLRRIAQTGIGAALEANFDLTSGSGRNLQLQALAVDLLFAEELVAVGLALR